MKISGWHLKVQENHEIHQDTLFYDIKLIMLNLISHLNLNYLVVKLHRCISINKAQSTNWKYLLIANNPYYIE